MSPILVPELKSVSRSLHYGIPGRSWAGESFPTCMFRLVSSRVPRCRFRLPTGRAGEVVSHHGHRVPGLAQFYPTGFLNGAL